MQRIEHEDRQEDMAARMGISVATYRKMENGNPSIPIGSWMRAFALIGTPENLLSCISVSLFDEDKLRSRRRISR